MSQQELQVITSKESLKNSNQVQPLPSGAVTTTTTTVVTKQPKGKFPPGAKIGKRPNISDESEKCKWATPILGCLDSPKNCCLACCCANCFLGRIATRMGENKKVNTMGPFGLLALRAKLRGKHNLEGNIADDNLQTTACYCCTVVQTANELDAQGYE